ncbi:hypothetical protein ES703_118810 [subsurface metagenome]
MWISGYQGIRVSGIRKLGDQVNGLTRVGFDFLDADTSFRGHKLTQILGRRSSLFARKRSVVGGGKIKD